jgi:hypothetical protein
MNREEFYKKHGMGYYKKLEEEITMQKKMLMPLLEKTTKDKYLEWLIGAIQSTTRMETVYYNYPWSRWDWYIAKNHLLKPVELYGANSFNIIVPSEFYIEYDKSKHMQWGHIKFFFLDNYRSSDNRMIFFSDCLPN